MPNLIHANIFFFVTTLAVVVITFFIVLLLIRLRALAKTLHRLLEKVHSATDQATEEVHEIVEDVKQSSLFRFFFPRRSKRASSAAKEVHRVPRRRV